MSAPSATCTQHALREAVGICVRCSSSLCSDCITKLDGINHCRSCLDALTRRVDDAATKRARRMPPWLALSFGLSLLSLMSWLMLEVMMPGGAAP